MALQSTYSDYHAEAYHGMIADTGPNNIISRTVEASGGVGFGVPVTQGTDDNGCDEISASTDEIIGITIRAADQEGILYDQYDAAPLMRSGVMWVTVTDASGVVPGDDVWVLVADGTFSNADAGSDGSIKINNARWETTGANGALARIRFDLDGGVTAGAS